jgi:hypothetical protein
LLTINVLRVFYWVIILIAGLIFNRVTIRRKFLFAFYHPPSPAQQAMNNLPPKYLTISIALVMMHLIPGTASAQNTSGGTALWDATTWSNTSPDRLDGVSTTNVADINDYDSDGTTRIGQGLETLGSGETVQIVGGDAITIDNTITGITDNPQE